MKILCASLPGPGHGHPMLAVARALAARGHEVTVATGPEHATDAARVRAAFVPLPVTPGSPPGSLRPYEDAAAMAEAFAPVVAGLAPDAAVADLITFGAALATEAAGVPWATLSIHGLHTPSRDLPPFGFGGPPGRGIARVRDAWMRRGARRDLARARDELNGARARIGLPATVRLDATLSPHLVLVATLPALEIPRSDWPARAHVVGPCLWDAAGPAPEPPPGDGPLVLIAASTAHEEGALVRAAIDAVGALGARAVVTMGRSEPPRDLPAGIVAFPFASHDAILGRCDAVVCNGGHGVVARALTHGVPLVVVPGHGDQRENAYRVARAGAGESVRRLRDLPAALGRVMSDPCLTEAARRIATEAASMDGPARAAELIEGLGEGPRLAQRSHQRTD